MNLQRNSFFESDIPLEEQVKDSIQEVTKRPLKLTGLFWFFFIQLCLAVFLLVMSALLPYFLLHG
jgi:hypothetical protein